ncbi:hypothetical protein CACET_c21450 [Clostridium aceticum]|uniref:Uncharacterized protein n=1 Tax=Clostridium aceticum TaxID=84022 RepID=A0A0D8I9X5_9CLOT|nr:hypothetical protein [Clostridium aceticum]AKL95592.1 hypothetical protein CACET_c21450 [Clostridium aceticum]KJF26834.1 hypothetical protein TZ02_11525 [Clostridium aceticum]
MKYVVCFSGGHSSAIAAIETVRKYGKNNVILLNHNISADVEHEDIKRFKKEVANYLEIEITYANMNGWRVKGPLDICMEIGAFKVGRGSALCTNRLKVMPFKKWLSNNFPSKPFETRQDVKIIYGFDKEEIKRIQRRIGILLSWGYQSDYPLALWNRTIKSTEEIQINRPQTYEIFKHANCMGCLNAGRQQWYIVYCLRRDLWDKAKKAEESIGYSILNGIYLEDIESKFRRMHCLGIVPTEKIHWQKFWALVRKELPDEGVLPCECSTG